MKKLVFVIFALFAFVAQADNVITSKEYVDTQASSLQEQIGANDANTVLTYTDTAGTVGEKKIYDSSAAYSGQNDALVTAGAFNTAVQNALESEFVCIERQAGTGGCLLYQIRPAYQKSRNLFDSSQLLEADGWTESNGVYTGSASAMFKAHGSPERFRFQHAFKPNTQYTLSYTMSGSGNDNLTRARFSIHYTDGTGQSAPYVASGQTEHIVLTTEVGKTIRDIWFTHGTNGQVSISNIQLEEGTVATPYVPYGNIYMPQGEQ